jgi:hypothetical protein
MALRLLIPFLYLLLLGACAQNGHFVPTANKSSTDQSAAPSGSMGTINGGGGVGIDCDGHLEMLDLYEARHQGLAFAAVNSQDEAIALVTQRFAGHFWNPETRPMEEHAKTLAKTIVEPIFALKPFVNAESKKTESVQMVDHLPLSNDFGKFQMPASCHLEQVAFYSDAHTELSIVQTAWSRLDWLSKAVLVSHELVYLLDRRDGLEGLLSTGVAHTSESARSFVGRLLSTTPWPTKADGLPASLYVCSSDFKAAQETTIEAYVFQRPGSQQLSLVFKSFFGHYSFYQMRSDFTQASLLGFLAGQAFDSAKLQLVGLDENSNFVVQLKNSEIELQFQQNAVRPSVTLTCRKL